MKLHRDSELFSTFMTKNHGICEIYNISREGVNYRSQYHYYMVTLTGIREFANEEIVDMVESLIILRTVDYMGAILTIGENNYSLALQGESRLQSDLCVEFSKLIGVECDIQLVSKTFI